MADSNVNIRINAQNNASPAIKQVGSDVAKLDKAAGTAAGGISGLAKVAGAAGLVAFGVQAAQAAVELANLGNQSIAMRASFEQMAGGAQNAATILQSLTEASRGTISQYDLMLNANRAMMLGVADTAEELSGLLQIAAVRGRALGLSTTQAFQDIVTGLGRESALILDNLGIVLDLDRTYQAYAENLGKTVSALTAAERKQAIVNKVIADSADIMATANDNANVFAGEGMAQLNTAWTDFRTVLGESLGPMLDARSKELTDFLAGTTDQLNAWQYEDKTVYAPQLAAVNVEQAKKQLDDLQAQLVDKTQNAQREIQEMILNPLDPNAFRDASQQYQRELDDLVASIQATQAELDKLTGKQQRTAKEAADAIISASNLGALSDATRPDITNDLALGDMQSRIREMLQQYQAASASLAEANRQGNAEAAAVAQSYFDSLIPAIRQAITDYNILADTMGRANIVGASYGNAEIIYQTAEALAAEKKAAEDAAKAIELIGEAGNKLDGLYDTLLDSGNIEGAKASFEAIKGVIQSITEEWVAQGIKQEEISGTLLPKLIAEIDNMIGKQIEAGEAGITAGELIGSGFLSSLPGIQTIIDAVAVLTGNILAAGEGIRAVQRQANLAERVFGGRGVRTGGGDIGLSRADATARGIVANERTGLRRQGPVVGDLVPLSVGGGGSGSSIDSELSALTGRVKGVLEGALKSGIDLDSILPRADAIEEPARRLADVAVRGMESPWAAWFQTEMPALWEELAQGGDIKQSAAQMLRNFEDGLDLRLLDKGKAKDLVRRALLGESNVSQMAAEIAAELSQEMGVSLQQAQQAASGVLGGSTTGDSTGLDGGAAAAVYTDSFVGAMAGMLTRYEGVGGSAGASFQVGFLAQTSQMPGAILANLAALLLPMLQAGLAAQGSRTGAS